MLFEVLQATMYAAVKSMPMTTMAMITVQSPLSSGTYVNGCQVTGVDKKLPRIKPAVKKDAATAIILLIFFFISMILIW